MLMVWLHFCSWLSHNDQDVLAQDTKSGTMWPSQVESGSSNTTQVLLNMERSSPVEASYVITVENQSLISTMLTQNLEKFQSS